MKPFDKDELQFLSEVGLHPDQLERVVEQAPPAPEDVQARIRASARRKIGLDAPPAAATPIRGLPWSRRWIPAAAALLVGVAGTLAVVGVPAAQAALERLLHLVPGIGITETSYETLVLVKPVTVQGERGDLTVQALISDGRGTELRFRIETEGPPVPKARDLEEQSVKAALILPDGKRLDLGGASTGAGSNHVTGELRFPAVPSDVRAVTLELSPIHGMTEAFTARLALVDIASAGLTQPVAGGWSQQQHGVALGAPNVAFEGDRIAVALQASLGREDVRIESIGQWGEPLTLTDDLGNQYPLVEDASELHYSSFRSLSASFSGPVAEGATATYLNVPTIQATGLEASRFRIPVAKLRSGETVELNQKVELGSHSLVVRSVTRVSEEHFALDLDLGTVKDGWLLQYVSITPYRASGGSSFELSGRQATAFEAFIQPKNGFLDLQFTPTYLVEGPWQIELPAR